MKSSDEVVKENLLKGRFLIEHDADEIQMLKLRNNMAKYNPNNLAMVISPTLYCSFSCPYCYVDREKKRMSPDTVLAVKKFFDMRIDGTNGVKVSWTGGEPLMALDIVEELGTYFRDGCRKKNKFYENSIVSNGYLLTLENVEKLKSLDIKSVQITIDGTSEFHNKSRCLPGGGDTFHTVFKNVCHATNNGLTIVLRSNVDKRNYKSIYSLLDLLAESDLNKENIVFSPSAVSIVKNENRDSDQSNTFNNIEYAEVEPKLLLYAANKGFRLGKGILSTRKAFCGANTLPLHVIDPYGNILKCWCHLGRSENNKVGKIKGDGTLEYTNINNLVRWMAWDPFAIDECLSCNVLPLCMGGCMYYNVMGETDQIDIGCSNRRHNIEEILTTYYLSIKKNEI